MTNGISKFYYIKIKEKNKMSNILIVSGHTDLNESVANKTILEEISNKLPKAEVDYLDKLYPDYKIDVKAEQEKLVKADVIVLQFPILWYSMPSIMSKWMEDTFENGFSHGSTGDKFKSTDNIISRLSVLFISFIYFH